MPLVRHRDNLSDLIRKGGEHKSHMKDERVKHSEMMIRNMAIIHGDGTVIRSQDEIWPALRFSAIFLYIAELPFVIITRFVAIIVAFTIVLAETSGSRSEGLQQAVWVLEFIVDCYYIIDGSVKVLSMYAYIEIVHNHMYHKISRMAYMRRSGLIDLAIALASLVYMREQQVNRWLHLVRCGFISLFYLEQLPQIDVLSSGISAGLTSTLYTWLLMTVTFLVYAAAGVIFFQENDPYHFGDLSMAMWTYFEMGTLDNWGNVLNINYWGCSEFDAGYYVNGSSPRVIETEFGSMYLPICWKSSAKPSSASLFFVSFVLICGFILVSLTVAFVTTGINTRLHELQKEEDAEELKQEAGSTKKIKFSLRKKIKKRITGSKDGSPSGPHSEDCHPMPNGGGSNSSMHSEKHSDRLMFSSKTSVHTQSSAPSNEVKDPELLRQLLKQVWKGDDNIIKEEEDVLDSGPVATRQGFTSTRSNSFFNKVHLTEGKKYNSAIQKRLLKFGVKMRTVVQNVYYNNFIYGVIIFAAVLELLSIQQLISTQIVDISSILCQAVFSVDLIIKFASCAPRYGSFLYNSWNIFDLVLVVLLWIPVILTGRNAYFELLKVLRIIRVLKMLSFIEELNVIIKSISSSARCLAYVIWFMLVFFFHFGAAGVYLFSKNDPFHFQDIGRSMLTLFQVSTLDNWGDVARMNMYGCQYIGYDPKFCRLEDSKGYGWLAAFYFVIFVIIGVMVLVALFIGVIITSMELLHTSIREEADMLKKVREKQTQFNINDATCNTLLEIFDMIDVCANGRLTLHELKPVLAMVSLGENQQYELFHKIDEDASGKIDFSEFCELIKLMGEAYSANNPTTPLKDNMTKIKILKSFGMRSRSIMPFAVPSTKGWGSITTTAVAAGVVTATKLESDLYNAQASKSPTASAPSKKQVSSFKRKSMMLTAARIESARVAEIDAMEEAKRAADADCLKLDDQSPAMSGMTIKSDKQIDDVRESSSGGKEPISVPPVSSAMASILKKKSQKASEVVADQRNVSSTLHVTPFPKLSANTEVKVGPVMTVETSFGDSDCTNDPSGLELKSSPKLSGNTIVKTEPVISAHTAVCNTVVVNKAVESPAEKESSFELPRMRRVEEEQKATELLPSRPGRQRGNLIELYSPQDAVIASLVRFPSDDSLVSNKYRSGRGNQIVLTREKLYSMRKYRSGPIIVSGRNGSPEETELVKKEPNLFFDYNVDSEDSIGIPKEVKKPNQSPPRHSGGASSSRG